MQQQQQITPLTAAQLSKGRHSGSRAGQQSKKATLFHEGNSNSAHPRWDLIEKARSARDGVDALLTRQELVKATLPLVNTRLSSHDFTVASLPQNSRVNAALPLLDLAGAVHYKSAQANLAKLSQENIKSSRSQRVHPEITQSLINKTEATTLQGGHAKTTLLLLQT